MECRYIFASIALAAVLLVQQDVVFAATAEELKQQIGAQSVQIDALEKEIAAFEKELTKVGAEKKTLQGAVKELDLSRQKVTATISVEQKKIATNEIEIQQLDSEIDEKETSLQKSNRAIQESLRRISVIDDRSMAELFLQEGSLGDFWQSLDGDFQFQAALGEHVEAVSQTKASLETAFEASTKKQQELTARRRALVAQKQALEATKSAKNELLSNTKEKESEYQKLLEKKRAEKIAFEAAMNELEAKLSYTLDPAKIPPAGKGILRWPLDKVRITQKFGNTAFSQSGAYNGKGHNGVDFGASVGTSVKASLSGSVVASGNTDAYKGCYSYGKWVLVRHGNGLSTLYAHLSSILVNNGQNIETGEAIGLSGNTGYSTGPHLHFTVFASDAVQIKKLGELKSKTNCAQASIPVSAFEGYLNPLEYL